MNIILIKKFVWKWLVINKIEFSRETTFYSKVELFDSIEKMFGNSKCC